MGAAKVEDDLISLGGLIESCKVPLEPSKDDAAPCVPQNARAVVVNIGDGDSSNDDGSELAKLFSFRTKEVLIKNFHSLVACSADLEIRDPFAFVADHVNTNYFTSQTA